MAGQCHVQRRFREYFRDTDFHDFLEAEHIERKDKTEWFHIDGLNSLKLFNRFASRERPSDHAEHRSYELRKEQKEAVEKTKAYFEQGGKEFLWNAKPRFGKTLSSYDLIRQMHCQTVLIVTNRPAISNSWADDFRTFIAWQEPLYFVADTDALRDNPDILTRDEYIKRLTMDETPHGMVAFISLQDLKGSKYFGGTFDKLKWVSDLSFDLLIVDEAQEGVDTLKTEVAFRYIHRKHTLYLSGTPFKALASENLLTRRSITGLMRMNRRPRKPGILMTIILMNHCPVSSCIHISSPHDRGHITAWSGPHRKRRYRGLCV